MFLAHGCDQQQLVVTAVAGLGVRDPSWRCPCQFSLWMIRQGQHDPMRARTQSLDPLASTEVLRATIGIMSRDLRSETQRHGFLSNTDAVRSTEVIPTEDVKTQYGSSSIKHLEGDLIMQAKSFKVQTLPPLPLPSLILVPGTLHRGSETPATHEERSWNCKPHVSAETPTKGSNWVTISQLISQVAAYPGPVHKTCNNRPVKLLLVPSFLS
jgi:hypothetical protein